MTTRTTEAEMAAVVKSILSHRPNKSASFAELRKIIPERHRLSKVDRSESPSRPGEELWMQILRNLVSHKHEGFVSIHGGIRLQWARGQKASQARRRDRGGHSEARLAA